MNQSKTKSVLIIEDDKDIRETFVELLELEGYTVQESCNGKQALELLRAGGPLPRLIFLDLMMPVMDGFQFRAEQIKDPALAAIAVVVMSANSYQREKVEKTGVEVFLDKPIDLDILIQITEKFLQP